MEVAIWYFCYRDQSYTTRVQLTVLDHNKYLNRGKACNKEGHELYARKFHKQTKKWDAIPLKEHKKYDYIPDV